MQRTDARRLGVVLAWASGSVLATATIGFGTQLAMFGLLGRREVGTYASIAVPIELLVGVLSVGFNQAVIRGRATRELLACGFSLVLVQCGVTLVAGALMAAILWPPISPQGVMPFVASLALVFARCCGFLVTLAYSPAESALDYQTPAAVRTIAALAGAVGGLAAAALTATYWAMVVRELFGAAIGCLAAGRTGVAAAPAWDRKSLGAILKFAVPNWTLTASDRLAFRMDQVVVLNVFGASTLGLYFAARSLVDGLVSLAVYPIQTAFFSWSISSPQRRKPVDWRVAPLAVMFSLVLGSLAARTARFWPADWSAAAALMGPLGAYAALVIGFEMLRAWFMARSVWPPVLAARCAQLFALCLVSPPLAVALGVTGAAAGTALAAAVLFGVLAAWPSPRDPASDRASERPDVAVAIT